MEATHITSNPRSGKLGMVNEDDDDNDDDDEQHRKCLCLQENADIMAQLKHSIHYVGQKMVLLDFIGFSTTREMKCLDCFQQK